jgi:hypothetical protein
MGVFGWREIGVFILIVIFILTCTVGMKMKMKIARKMPLNPSPFSLPSAPPSFVV